MREAPAFAGASFATSSTRKVKAAPATPANPASAPTTCRSKYRDIFEQRNNAEDDHDDAHDLLGAAVKRQQINQIENENNNEKGDQYTCKHWFSPIHVEVRVSLCQRTKGTPVPFAEQTETSAKSRLRATSARTMTGRRGPGNLAGKGAYFAATTGTRR